MNDKKDSRKEAPSQNRLLQTVFKWVIILGGFVAVGYGILWAGTHPNNPVAVISVIVLAGGWLYFLNRPQKQGDNSAPLKPSNKKPSNSPMIVIYDNYKAIIGNKLTTWGFVVTESEEWLGGNTTYKCGQLEVNLGYDTRGAEVYLTASSGKSMKYPLDEFTRLTGNKLTNYDEVANRLIDKADISTPLNGSTEEQKRLIQTLEDWYLANS